MKRLERSDRELLAVVQLWLGLFCTAISALVIATQISPWVLLPLAFVALAFLGFVQTNQQGDGDK